MELISTIISVVIVGLFDLAFAIPTAIGVLFLAAAVIKGRVEIKFGKDSENESILTISLYGKGN